MTGRGGGIQSAALPADSLPGSLFSPPDPQEARRAAWRAKARRQRDRQRAELGVEAVRTLWREKARLDYASNAPVRRATARVRARAMGIRPRADALIADHTTIVGVGDRTCERCGVPFTHQRLAPHQRFCSSSCRRARHSANQVRVRYALRASVIAASGGACYLCSRPIDETLKAPHPLSLSIDHVKPLALGGRNDPDNLRATHLGCNIEKADELPPWWIGA